MFQDTHHNTPGRQRTVTQLYLCVVQRNAHRPLPSYVRIRIRYALGESEFLHTSTSTSLN